MEEINLYALLRYYGRNWLNLMSALLIGAIIGVIYTGFVQTPLYKSEATMLVVDSQSDKDININNNYTELFKSRRVLETTIDSQNYSGDYEQLLAHTTATNEKDTDIIKVSIADTDGQKSEQLLTKSLETFKKEASQLYETSNIKTVDAASRPFEAYNVNIVMQIALAMAASFMLMVIVLFFIYDYKTSQPQKTLASTGKATKQKNSKVAAKSKQEASAVKRKPSIGSRAAAMLMGDSSRASMGTKKSNKS